MKLLRSKLDTRSGEYQQNLAAMESLWSQVETLMASVPSIGGQRYVDRHHKRGKMLPRERIEQLVDPGTPVLELSALAGWGSEFPIGAGTANVIGIIEGVECAISATDMTYRGGSMNPRSVDKGQRFREIVLANRLPWISLNESAGADLPHQADIFIRGGEGFATRLRASSSGFPRSPSVSAPQRRAAPTRRA